MLLQRCGALGAAALGAGIAYRRCSAASAAHTPSSPDMHPAHTRRLTTAAEFNSFVSGNVAEGKTVFVRWIHNPE